MDYEKKYKEALERAKKWYYAPNADKMPTYANRIIKEIFPELKESEGEKIRKEIADFIYISAFKPKDIKKKEKWLTWLEKQGNQKPVISDDALREGITHFGITQYQIDDWLKKYVNVEKQGEQKLCMIQWKGDNLKEVINFTGKDKNFDKWFTSFEEYEKYVREHNDIFKLFNEDGSHYEVPVGAWIIKTPDGRNVASKAVLKQKLADKTEPKFKVGDWIIHQGTNNIYQVVAVIDNQYQLKYGDNYTIQNCADVDRCARLWDITKDAKKGDVLRHNGCTFIFICIEKGVVKGLEENLCNGTKACNLGEPNKNNDYSPATKEQRDILFAKMEEAGYQWNAEKKELKLLITNGGDFEQKQEWSDEDDYNLQCMIAKVTLDIQKGNIGRNNELIDWLKSIKQRIEWKPSEEQMEAFEHFVRSFGESGTISPYSDNTKLLYSLLQDLKKL